MLENRFVKQAELNGSIVMSRFESYLISTQSHYSMDFRFLSIIYDSKKLSVSLVIFRLYKSLLHYNIVFTKSSVGGSVNNPAS